MLIKINHKKLNFYNKFGNKNIKNIIVKIYKILNLLMIS